MKSWIEKILLSAGISILGIYSIVEGVISWICCSIYYLVGSVVFYIQGGNWIGWVALLVTTSESRYFIKKGLYFIENSFSDPYDLAKLDDQHADEVIREMQEIRL